MPNLVVPYSLLVISVLCFINYFVSLYRAKECYRVKYGYGSSRQTFAVFQKQCRIAKGSGNSKRIRQIKLEHSELFRRYLIAKLSFILGLILFIPGVIWLAEVKFGQGLATSAAILGIFFLYLTIFAITSYSRASQVYIYPLCQSKRVERRVFKQFLTTAIAGKDYWKILQMRTEQPEFLFYDNLWENSATAACLVFIPFALGLIHVIWY